MSFIADKLGATLSWKGYVPPDKSYKGDIGSQYELYTSKQGWVLLNKHSGSYFDGQKACIIDFGHYIEGRQNADSVSCLPGESGLREAFQEISKFKLKWAGLNEVQSHMYGLYLQEGSAGRWVLTRPLYVVISQENRKFISCISEVGAMSVIVQPL